MNVLLWVLQGVLALVFAMAGFMKLGKTKDEMKQQGKGRMDWVTDVSGGNIKVIGSLEILGGIGLILPQITGIVPWLTPISALGLVLVMIFAIMLHARRSDGVQTFVTNILLLLFAAIIAYGRFTLLSA